MYLYHLIIESLRVILILLRHVMMEQWKHLKIKKLIKIKKIKKPIGLSFNQKVSGAWGTSLTEHRIIFKKISRICILLNCLEVFLQDVHTIITFQDNFSAQFSKYV